MTTRKLIHEDDTVATYEVYDDNGDRIGTDVESKAPAEPSDLERIAALLVEAGVDPDVVAKTLGTDAGRVADVKVAVIDVQPSPVVAVKA